MTATHDPVTPRAATGARRVPANGRTRVVIEDVRPAVDAGRFPIKRAVGETVTVECDAFADGHDEIAVRLRHRPPGGRDWIELVMEPLGNDRFRAAFAVEAVGRHAYAVTAWVDRFATWRRDLAKRLDAGDDVGVDLLIGAQVIETAAGDAPPAVREEIAARLGSLSDARPPDERGREALDPQLADLMAAHGPRPSEVGPDQVLEVVVDPVHARYGTWYELFPRSTSRDPGRAGTLRDVIERLDYVADLGFDVLYLPPIHPIGRAFRKGANNRTDARVGDPGVPWAIGGIEGGHAAIHPDLGTLDDFRALVAAAEQRGIRIALDLAFQASPDHPFVREHPSWFRARPDGTIQYAENPPKKYQDIYPFDFESEDWPGLWRALLDVTRFWIAQGVRIFRVDNPHTKPFGFWEWLIAEIKRDEPDVLFLAEAFTRPKVMYRLAKLGFSQSYTYFTWRTTAAEMRDYLAELTSPPVSDFFRPNLWPNTPDILHEVLQRGGRPAFQGRFVLAATLAATYGIYGPAFELGERVPREAGSEEYLNSEKYEVRHWDLEAPDSIGPLIRAVNAVRRDHPALQTNDGLVFHATGDDRILAYTKRAGSDIVLAVVSFDYETARTAEIDLPLDDLGLGGGRPFEPRELLPPASATWSGSRASVRLDPAGCPAAIFDLGRWP